MAKQKLRVKRKYIIISIFTLLILLCFTGAFLLYKKVKNDKIYDELSITFIDIKQIEYGEEELTSKDLIKAMTGNIEHYPQIDVHKIGKQKITYILTKDHVEKKITHEIEVRDTKAPIIQLNKELITLKFGQKYDPNDNIKEVKDPVDGALDYAKEEGILNYWIITDFDCEKAGKYIVTVYAKDQHNNQSKQSFTINVEENVDQSVSPNTPNKDNTSNGTATSEISPYYVNGILLVNKQHGLPKSFGGGVDANAYTALKQLQDAASSNGFSMPLISGYRSYDYQTSLYNNYVAIDGEDAANRYSAKPGYSEHQTGLAFDIGELNYQFGETPAGIWLAQHAHEYGFIIRYPQGKENVTGYMYEPWHVRYLGDQASSVYASGLTLEEYLGAS